LAIPASSAEVGSIAAAREQRGSEKKSPEFCDGTFLGEIGLSQNGQGKHHNIEGFLSSYTRPPPETNMKDNYELHNFIVPLHNSILS
jgi:hypothetical protein